MKSLHEQKISNPSKQKQQTELSPFLEWQFKVDDKTGNKELTSIQLSNGSKPSTENVNKALKEAFGTPDPKIGERILNKVAKGLTSAEFDQRINETAALLPSLEPQSAAEALLLGQFLALNDSGMKCLQLANLQNQGFYHVERLFTLAHKLLNTANQTMQTVLKYRTGGQQTVQVIHVHNEGQAIVAQNLSSHHNARGSREIFKTEPHGSL